MDTKSIKQPLNFHYTPPRYKPFIKYKNTLNQDASKQFRKRFIKYLHHADQIRLPWRESVLIKQIKQLKLVYEVDTTFNYHSSSLKISHVLKAFKPLRKHIKHLITSKDRILTHFPYLSSYTLRAGDPLSWKIFLRFRALKRLEINWEPRSQENSMLYRIKKFRIRFAKVFNNSKSLKHLSLYIPKCYKNSDFERCTWMLSLIIPSLQRLKTFSIQGIDALTELPKHENTSFVQILNHVTHFHPPTDSKYLCWDPLNCNTYFGINRLKNLVNLSLDDSVLLIKNSDNLCNLTYIKQLYNLKTLYLHLEDQKFTEFSTYFTLPKTIESITLRLHGFEWDRRDFQQIKNIDAYMDKNRIYQAFFDQWKGLDRLTDLTLIVESREDYASKFVACIIKRLCSLEILTYKQILSKGHSYHYEVCLKDVWKAFEKSRLTLQEILIIGQYLSLSQIENVNFDMPKLKNLSLKSGGRYSSQDLIEQLTKFSSLNWQGFMLSMSIQGVIIRSDKDFALFDLIKEGFKNMKLDLGVFVEEGKPEIFTKSLCNLLNQNKLQGSLSAIVPEKCVYSMQNLRKLEQAAVRNTSLRHFKMVLPEGLTYFEVENGSLVYDYENQYATLHLYYNSS